MIRKLYQNLSAQLRLKSIKTLVLVIINGILQSLGVVSIAPVLSLIVDPDLVTENQLFSRAFNFTVNHGIGTPYEFIKLLAFLSILLIAVSLVIKIFSTSKVNYLVENIRHELSSSVFSNYVQQDYQNVVNKHSSEYSKVVLSEIDMLTAGLLRPLIHALGATVISLILSVFISVAIGIEAVLLIVILFSFYLISNSLIKNLLRRISIENLTNNKKRFHIVSETFSNIKSLKVNVIEHLFIDNFKRSSLDFTNGVAKGVTWKVVPNLLVESMIYISLLFAIIVKLSVQTSLGELVSDSSFFSSITIIGLSFIRLKPAIDMTFSGFLALKSSKPSLEVVLNALYLKRPNTHRTDKIEYSRMLELRNISFSYPDGQTVLSEINISLTRGEAVALTGVTGTGKSTFVDLIMGLLNYNEGNIMVDGVKLTRLSIASWRNSVSYVTQEALILDDTVKANILFGFPGKDHASRFSCLF